MSTERQALPDNDSPEDLLPDDHLSGNHSDDFKSSRGFKLILLSIILISLAVGFLLVELGFRWWKRESLTEWRNYRNDFVFNRPCVTGFDSFLGWKPVANVSGRTASHKTVTITPLGVRSNGLGKRLFYYSEKQSEPLAGEPLSIGEYSQYPKQPDSLIREPSSILALGDSYVFGDEVSDTQTWPSFCNLALGRGFLMLAYVAMESDKPFSAENSF